MIVYSHPRAHSDIIITAEEAITMMS